ncbi:MAG: protein phosphatase 2C domain-containing protein [Sandaracinaceae bacterium]|nr:MAG: serine/threonine-protein phosphatase [Sandaracinaceae bacterium]
MSEMNLYLIAGAAAVVLVGSLVLLARTGGDPAQPEPDAKKKPPKRPTSPKPIEPLEAQEGDAEEVTIVRLQLDPSDFPDVIFDDESEEIDPVAKAIQLVADDGADEDEPTRTSAVILVSAAGQTDRGQKRKRNEDRFLRLDGHGVYAVADGMGGYAGGDVASETAVETIAQAFRESSFEGKVRGDLPRRAMELAQAVQMANIAIFREALRQPHLEGMGTTLVATRFALRKERLYLAHVGDSRCYRIRGGEIQQLTTDHTLGNLGLTGPHAAYLSRALGIKPEVTIDVIVGKPEPGDLYLLCSDGLTKMIPDDEEILRVVNENPKNMDLAVQKLVDLANERGGKDNVTVLLVGVRLPADLGLPD